MADDDPTFRTLLAHLLSQSGFLVCTVATAPALEAALQTSSWDAVVAEPNLPLGNWFATIELLGEQTNISKTVVVSKYRSRALERVANERGLPVLTKSTRLDGVLRAIHAPDMPAANEALASPRMQSLARNEWEYLNEAIYQCRGNLSEAARLLQIPRQTLYRKLRKYPPEI
ncbi:MAG: hypothetical protein KA712_06725 [Myxococcales bacterium]|nr:hypothetical protein [Myxococcales bacterium]